jgi:ABC-2 type transport system permease protein
MSNNNSLIAVNRWERIVRYSAYVVIILAAFTGFYYVHAFGVNLFWMDEWDVVPVLYEHYSDGALTWADLWKPHNEHRIFFPKLVMLGLGLLTKGNAVANLYFIEILLTATLGVYILAFRKQCNRAADVWLMVPVAFLIFSLAQHQNMLWGILMAFIMVALMAQCAFFALSRLGNEKYISMFICAVLAATVATYSSIQGILVWPVGFGQLLIVPLAKRLKIALVALWTVIGAAEWLLFFIGWNVPEHDGIGFSLAYFVALAGESLLSYKNLTMVAGAMVLLFAVIAVVIVLIRRQWSTQSFWLATMAFSLATLAAITAGRSGMGVMQAITSSRYATFSIPLVAATYVIFASQTGKRFARISALLTGAVLSLTVFGTSVSFIDGLEYGRRIKEIYQWQQMVVCSIDSQPDEMIMVHPSKDVARKYSAVLKKLQYGVFADQDLCERSRLPDPSLPVLSAATRCAIDDISPMPNTDNQLTTVRGWAVDSPAGDIAGGVTVIIDSVAYQTYYGLRNDNAAKQLGSDKFLYSGFKCIVPAKLLGTGEYKIFLKILSRDRKGIYYIQ